MLTYPGKASDVLSHSFSFIWELEDAFRCNLLRGAVMKVSSMG